jgi:hypothetical protein
MAISTNLKGNNSKIVWNLKEVKDLKNKNLKLFMKLLEVPYLWNQNIPGSFWYRIYTIKTIKD